MTSPNRPDDDRLSQLLDVALSGTDTAMLDDLSDADRDEVARLSALLSAIDDAWQASDSDRQRVRTLFLQHLSAKYPGHPWVRASTVRTLGDLLRFDRDEAPALPAEALAKLEEDPTPVESLFDPAQRTAVVGRAVQQAGLSTTLITVFMRWLNRALAQLSPASDSGTQGLLFTRPQSYKGRHQPSERG